MCTKLAAERDAFLGKEDYGDPSLAVSLDRDSFECIDRCAISDKAELSMMCVRKERIRMDEPGPEKSKHVGVQFLFPK